jgi:hypothetical protein
MERRKFVLLSSALGTAVVLKAFASFNTELNPELISGANSLDLIWNHNTLRDIGLKYRDLFPTENISETLVNSLSTDFIDEFSMRLELEKRITKDFENDQIIILDGWLISLTEARQCALYSTLTT